MASTSKNQTQKPQPAAVAAPNPPPPTPAAPIAPPATTAPPPTVAPAQQPASDRSFTLPADEKHLIKPDNHHSHIHDHAHHHHEAHTHQPAGHHTHHPETVPHHNPTPAAPAAPTPKPVETPSKPAAPASTPPSVPVKPAAPPSAPVKCADTPSADTTKTSEDKKAAAPPDPLKGKAERLLKAAQRASDAAKRAYTAGVQTAQTHAKNIADVVTQNAHNSKDSSKVFLSKVASRMRRKSAASPAPAAETHPRGVEEPERVSFPLSILLWCSTLCSRRTAEPPPTPADAGVSVSREPAELPGVDDEDDGSESFSQEFLASAADEFCAALEQHATELESAIDAHAVHTPNK